MDQVKFVKTAFKNLKWYGLPKQTILLQKILKAIFHKFYLVRSWINFKALLYVSLGP